MASRRYSSPPGRLPHTVGISLAGLLAIALVIASTSFDYRRAGQFPHAANSVLGPISSVLRFSRSASPSAELARAPVAAFPLWEEGSRVAKAGDENRARALITEAVRRDPQLFEARVWLATDSVKTGRFADAIRHLDWLYTINSAARPGLVPMIAALARLPQAQRPVAAFVAARKPRWLPDVASQLAGGNADPAIIFQLLNGASGTATSAGAGASGLVGWLVARKDYEGAYLAWISSLPQSALATVGYIYDPDFRQRAGALPFNWNLLDSSGASVDFVKGGGVEISYYGDAPVHLMEQTMLLPRGRFKFVALASSAGTRDANRAAWSIVCASAPTSPLGRLDVPMAPSPVPRAIVFDVPDNCPAQVLNLDGVPAEYPTAADVRIKAVAIKRSAGGQ